MPSNEKITAIYCRLSSEDEIKKDESNSIKNQRLMLEKHAKLLKLENIHFYVDDGLSGVFFDRPAFMELMTLVEQNRVDTVIVKDLSRLGRNYRETGEITEKIFPYYNIRFIAIGDGIDQKNELDPRRLNGGIDITVAFKNLMNECYVQDISNKVRLSNITKSSQGYAIGKPPYGYKYNESNNKLWSVDEEAALVIKKIFQLRLTGKSTIQIANMLRHEKVLIPAVYAVKKGYTTKTRAIRGDCFWNQNTISQFLKNQCYTGDVTNFKTYTLSYKDRTKHLNDKENWEIHKAIHEPIIDRTVWEQVQQSFKRHARVATKDIPKHPLAGFLVCSDCGANLNYKHLKNAPQNDYFSCGNNRRSGNVLCKETHHIRVDHIQTLVTRELDKIVRFARDFEEDFVKIVISERYKQIELEKGQRKKILVDLKTRSKEIDTLFHRMYEDKVKGVLSEERFVSMTRQFDEEQLQLKEKLRYQQKLVDEDDSHKLDVNMFLGEVQQFTRINELTPEVVRTFIDKVVVHHRVEENGLREQKVEIYYNFVGQVAIPDVDTKEHYQKSFGKNIKIGKKKENHTAVAV